MSNFICPQCKETNILRRETQSGVIIIDDYKLNENGNAGEHISTDSDETFNYELYVSFICNECNYESEDLNNFKGED